MSEYKGIKGFQVTTRTEDPTPFAQALADNPYGGSWASGGTRNEARGALGGTIMGTQTANVAAGGNLSGSVSANAETYNGSSWTEGNNLNQARRSLMAAGLEPAGRVFGGDTSVNSTGFVATNESYNGTSFTEETDLNTGAGAGTGIGLTTASLAVGGSTGPGAPNYSNKVENWDGSSWTEVSEINTTRIRGGGAGITTAALFFGGQAAPGASNSVESWNGSSWTETTEINTARGYVGSAGASYTAALIYGGSPSRAITESWDGSSWTEVADLATGQSDNFGIVNGTNLLALSSGGETSPNAVTEEWSFSGVQPTDLANYVDAITGDFYYNSTTGQFKTVNDGGQPVGTWASVSGINTGRAYFAGAGTATDSIVFGGYSAPGPPTATVEDTEIWNGSSWTEVSNLNEAPYYNMAGSGASSTAALCYAGQGAGSRKNNVESWNGSSWTEITGINTARSGAAGVGPQTAAMCFGGNTYNPPPSVVYQALTEIWNGSSWTEVNDLNTARGDIAPVGSVYTDVLAVSGGAPNKTNNESFNGTSWTELADTNTTASSRSGSGVPAGPTAIVSGGYAPGVTANTEAWDGSSWTETGDLALARGKSAESASSTAGFQVGGETPSTPKNTNVEQFSFDDFQIKTVTTS